MSNAPSLSASASWRLNNPSPHLGHRRCEMLGTRISSPFTDEVTASWVLRIIVPHVGQASSGSTTARRLAAVTRGFGLVFVLITRLPPVERDDDAVGSQNQLHVQRGPRHQRLEDV